MKETIPLMVHIKGIGDIEVQGWMYVLAFALRGILWAIEEAMKFEFREIVKQYQRDQHNYEINQEIDSLLKRIEELKKELLL